MSPKGHDRSRLFVAPARQPVVRQAVDALKKQPGLWERLCRASLWQWPTVDGKPVHDERSALCAILNQLGHWETGCHELADAFFKELGARQIQVLLAQVDIAELDRDAWLYWMRRSGSPTSPKQCPAPEKFADGWHLRAMAPTARTEGPESMPLSGDDSPHDPRAIPPTGEDEKVLWCFDDRSGQVYPLVY